jgi:hypothetical protein
MNCTPEQCEELTALRIVLQAELTVIEAEQILLQEEFYSVSAAIEAVNGCIDYCECNQAAMSSTEPKEASPELKARMDMVKALMRLVRRHPPAANAPKQV